MRSSMVIGLTGLPPGLPLWPFKVLAKEPGAANGVMVDAVLQRDDAGIGPDERPVLPADV